METGRTSLPDALAARVLLFGNPRYFVTCTRLFTVAGHHKDALRTTDKDTLQTNLRTRQLSTSGP